MNNKIVHRWVATDAKNSNKDAIKTKIRKNFRVEGINNL